MKIGWKIRKVMTLWSFANFSRNISWPVGMNMQMSELMMSPPHNFPFILCTEMTKVSYFSYENACLNSFLNRCRIMLNSNTAWYEGHTITSMRKILNFSTFYVQNIWQVVRRWHHQLAHLHIHIDWSRNVLWKFAKLQSVVTFLIFQPIFIRISLFCSQYFTLSSEIKLNPVPEFPFKFHGTFWRTLLTSCSKCRCCQAYLFSEYKNNNVHQYLSRYSREFQTTDLPIIE